MPATRKRSPKKTQDAFEKTLERAERSKMDKAELAGAAGRKEVKAQRGLEGFAMRAGGTSSPPFALEGIEHILLLVHALEPALAFYQDVLGAQLELRLPEHAMAEVRVGASHLDLVDTSAPEGRWARPPVAGGRNVDHIGLRVQAEEAALRRHLAAYGVEIIEERANEAPFGRSFYIRDPSGNVVELMT